MAARLPTYYDVLRVERTATGESIRRAYRRLANQYHPDKLPGNANAARAMAAINAAYEVLSDAHRRAEHDLWIRRAEEAPRPRHPVDVDERPKRWPWVLLFATVTVSVVTVVGTYLLASLPARIIP